VVTRFDGAKRRVVREETDYDAMIWDYGLGMSGEGERQLEQLIYINVVTRPTPFWVVPRGWGLPS
jgi:hypothetical protein